LRGVPFDAKEPEIIDFLKHIRVYKEDIAFLFDAENKFTGEVFIKLCNENDKNMALSYSMSNM
jgi:hypothetical protein